MKKLNLALALGFLFLAPNMNAWAQEGVGETAPEKHDFKLINSNLKQLCDELKVSFGEVLKELRLAFPEKANANPDAVTMRGKLNLAHTVWSLKESELNASMILKKGEPWTQSKGTHLLTEFKFDLKTESVKMFRHYASMYSVFVDPQSDLGSLVFAFKAAKSVDDLYRVFSDLVVLYKKYNADSPAGQFFNDLTISVDQYSEVKELESAQNVPPKKVEVFTVKFKKGVSEPVDVPMGDIGVGYAVQAPKLTISAKGILLEGTIYEQKWQEDAFESVKDRMLRGIESGEAIEWYKPELQDFIRELLTP